MTDRRKELLNRVAVWAFDKGQKLFLKEDIAVVERRGARLGMLLYRLDQKHRERTDSNLNLAFPDWSTERRLEVAKGVFRHWGIVTADFLRSPIRRATEVLETTEQLGLENLLKVEAVGKGVLVVTAHLGNFERFGQYSQSSNRPISVVARDANQGDIQARIAAVRAKTGMEVISRGDAARPILAKLRKKGMVGILPDQNSDECFVPFFGKACGTVLGPAVIHLRTGAPIMPAYCVRIGVGRYRAIACEPINFDNSEKDPVAIMAQVNAVLENQIRLYPEQWLWMHDRWKSARLSGRLES